MDNGSAEISTPIGSVKVGGKRMAEIIAVLCLSLLLVHTYVLYTHTNDSRAGEEKLSAAIREMASAQREMACIISLPQERREREYATQNGFCRTMAKMQ